MIPTVDVEEASQHLGELLRKVKEEGTAVVVERGGEPQAVLGPVPEHVGLPATGSDRLGAWLDRVDLLRKQLRKELNGRRLPPAEELIDGGRDERDDHLAGLR